MRDVECANGVETRAELLSLRRRDVFQRAGVAELHVEVDRIEIEAIRPGRRAQLEEDAGEILQRLQGHDHFALSGGDAAEVVDAFAAVAEAQPELVVRKRFHSEYVDHRETQFIDTRATIFPAAAWRTIRARRLGEAAGCIAELRKRISAALKVGDLVSLQNAYAYAELAQEPIVIVPLQEKWIRSIWYSVRKTQLTSM